MKQWQNIENHTNILIAIGSNLASRQGDSLELCGAAVAGLTPLGIIPSAVSRPFQTPAFPAESGPDFVNGVVLARTKLPPQHTLEALHQIENDMGRERQRRWGARVIDLDLLFYGDLVLPDLASFNAWYTLPLDQQKTDIPQKLILPHPRIQDRAFVLVPALDVAPDWIHPVLKRSLRDLANAMPNADISQVQPISPHPLSSL
jgi:2-amino-4-hydroxy-6-hydroxymethyldihydropteridine diphosphokinase